MSSSNYIDNLEYFSRNSISDSKLLRLLCQCLSSKVILVDLISLELVLSIIKNLRDTLSVTRILFCYIVKTCRTQSTSTINYTQSIIRNQLRVINYALLIA